MSWHPQIENMCSHESLYIDAHSDIICNRLSEKTSQMSVNLWVSKQIWDNLDMGYSSCHWNSSLPLKFIIPYFEATKRTFQIYESDFSIHFWNLSSSVLKVYLFSCYVCVCLGVCVYTIYMLHMCASGCRDQKRVLDLE